MNWKHESSKKIHRIKKFRAIYRPINSSFPSTRFLIPVQNPLSKNLGARGTSDIQIHVCVFVPLLDSAFQWVSSLQLPTPFPNHSCYLFPLIFVNKQECYYYPYFTENRNYKLDYWYKFESLGFESKCFSSFLRILLVFHGKELERPQLQADTKIMHILF